MPEVTPHYWWLHPLFFAALLLVGGLLVSGLICYLILRFWPANLSGWDGGDIVRKAQKSPVLRLGGVGVALAFAFVTPVAGGLFFDGVSRVGEPWPLLFVCLLFFSIGLVDDLYSVPPLLKLAMQVLAASCAYGIGFRIELLTEPIAGTSIQLRGLSFPLTIIWIIAIPNLINLVDGMDGIAGGVGISLSGTLAVVAWLGNDWFMLAMSMGMIGAIVGFLCFNLPKARIYLGDGGAYLLGAFIAVMSISASQKGTVAGALFVIVLALALPIADTVFAILRRTFYGLPVWRADSEHIHHRLVTLGVRRGVVIGGMLATVLFFSLLGLSLIMKKGQTWPIVLTVCVITTLFLVRLLGYWRSFSAFRDHVKRILITRERLRYAYALSCVLEHEIDRAAGSEEFWADFHRSLRKVGLRPVSERFDPDGLDAGWELFEVNLADNSIWKLTHREGNVNMHWGKIVSCFLGPVSRAMGKWGEVPDDFGIVAPCKTGGKHPHNFNRRKGKDAFRSV